MNTFPLLSSYDFLSETLHRSFPTQLQTDMPLQNQFGGQEFENWLEELGNSSLNDERDYVIIPQALRCSTHEIGDLINFAYSPFTSRSLTTVLPKSKSGLVTTIVE